MTQCTVIILSGSITPTALRLDVGLPVPCLPVMPSTPLICQWLAVARSVPLADEVRIVVNTEDDAAIYEEEIRLASKLASASTDAATPQAQHRVLVEPSSWRGTAGILRDLSSAIDPESLVIAIEASMAPPRSLLPLIQPFDDVLMGAVGASASDEPNGTFAFRREVFEHVPHIGYFDLKEQFLPRLHRKGLRVRATRFGDSVIRVRDRRSYLHAVRAELDQHGHSDGVSAEATVETGARIVETNLIEHGAVIETGAIVHESIVLRGARIGSNALVSRSVVAPGARVLSDTRRVREIVRSDITRQTEAPVTRDRRRRA